MKRYLSSLPSRRGHVPSVSSEKHHDEVDGGVYIQNGNVYPHPHSFNIYTDYLKSLYSVVPNDEIQ